MFIIIMCSHFLMSTVYSVHESGKRLELVAGFVQRHLQLIAILDMYTIDSVLYPTPLGLEIVVEIDLWLFDMRVRTNRRREAMR